MIMNERILDQVQIPNFDHAVVKYKLLFYCDFSLSRQW